MVNLRPAGPTDADLLVDLVVAAVDWSGVAAIGRTEVLDDDHLVRYVEGWPRAGDRGVVALDAQGVPIGGAWLRVFPPSRPGYGYVAATVPELSLAVLATARGQGIGSALLDACLATDPTAVSLSVEDGNDRARAMYLRRGFTKVGRVGRSDVLLRGTPGRPQPAAR